MFSEFPARFSKDPDDGGIVVTFPDIPEAITEGDTLEQATAQAKDCLLAALGGYLAANRSLPQASKPKRGQRLVQLRPLHVAKLLLYQTMKAQKLTRVALADKLGLSEGAVRRLLDLDHNSRLDHVERALEALGKRLVVRVESAA